MLSECSRVKSFLLRLYYKSQILQMQEKTVAITTFRMIKQNISFVFVQFILIYAGARHEKNQKLV